MAPVKFGLFKARSRDYQEQPSTENLLHTSNSSDHVATPSSPIPSTSKGVVEEQVSSHADLSLLEDTDDEEASHPSTPTRRLSGCSLDEPQVHYEPLRNQSIDLTSVSTLQDYDQTDPHEPKADISDGASTSCDALSLQLDPSTYSEQTVPCVKKPRKSRSKEEKFLRDADMWRATNVEVMQNLLSRSGTLDEQIKWEAIATARGLCTLTESCTCADCTGTKYLAGIADGDGGLGTAPLFSAIGVGCQLQ